MLYELREHGTGRLVAISPTAMPTTRGEWVPIDPGPGALAPAPRTELVNGQPRYWTLDDVQRLLNSHRGR